MKYSIELEEYYINEYRKLHTDQTLLKRGWIYGYGDGKATADKLDYIKELITRYNAKSLLDYGCGKAIHHVEKKLYDSIGMHDVGLYDPAVESYKIMPDRTYDAVVCVDVMEHIPEQNIEHTLDTIVSKANLFVFFAISCNPARDKLSDGSNAHVTQKQPSWWLSKLSKYDTPIHVMTSHGKVNMYYDMKAGTSYEV